MDKHTFVSQIKPLLKRKGYRKAGNYWYKQQDKHLCCVYVQGSSWDKNDYYVEIGFSIPSLEAKNPTVLHWHCRHRCVGAFGEKNISPEDTMKVIEKVLDPIMLSSQIPYFLNNCNAEKIASQIWF